MYVQFGLVFSHVTLPVLKMQYPLAGVFSEFHAAAALFELEVMYTADVVVVDGSGCFFNAVVGMFAGIPSGAYSFSPDDN
ncbi:hypothetical protein Nepgr_033712 [Nepenthes gracilis]|uniref:Uncharacterized protein n=1 Tax=Nepenthes gracilis TaxID=150966 RepID=A0AAD3TMV8_NEPGR|nr:hypothetical protein Nepgr_033712 [Nepenthes gracilis]